MPPGAAGEDWVRPRAWWGTVGIEMEIAGREDVTYKAMQLLFITKGIFFHCQFWWY